MIVTTNLFGDILSDLAAGLVGAITYRNALAEAESLFDYQLRQMALGLRDQGEIAPGEAAALPGITR